MGYRYFAFLLGLLSFATTLAANNASFTLQGRVGDAGADFSATSDYVLSQVAAATQLLSIDLMPVGSTGQHVAAGDHAHDGIYAHVDGTSSLADIDTATVTELSPQLLTLTPATALPTCDGTRDGQLLYFAQQLHLCHANRWTALQPTCTMGNVGEMLVTDTAYLLCDGVAWQITLR